MGVVVRMGAILALVCVVAVTTGYAGEDQPVKKSRSGICHCPGGAYYDRTTSFTPFNSIDECLSGGGRHPPNLQGIRAIAPSTNRRI